MLKSNLLISVNHIGRIPPLYQDGPVVNPIRVDIKTAHAIVCSLFPAYEHNPANPSEKVKLTLQNLFEDNFPPFIPEVKTETPPKGKDVEIVSSKELPAPDRVKEVSVVETKVDDTISSVTEDTVEDSVDEVDTTETPAEEETPVKPLTLNEKAIALGINPEGMSRNKLKAAIKEAEAKK